MCVRSAGRGTLGAVRNGDIIVLDVDKGILNVELSEKQILNGCKKSKSSQRSIFPADLSAIILIPFYRLMKADFPYLQAKEAGK